MHINSLIDQLQGTQKDVEFWKAKQGISLERLFNVRKQRDEIISKLITADKAYDLLVIDNANLGKECAKLATDLTNANRLLNQANARTFTGRKRNNRGQFVTVAKDVEP